LQYIILADGNIKERPEDIFRSGIYILIPANFWPKQRGKES
jgi:hypothetical protein